MRNLFRSLIVSTFFLVRAVHSDILFIDTNFSEVEVAAAKAAAAKRNEKLIVIPEIPLSEHQKIRAVQKLERDYHERLVASGEGKPMVNKPTDEKLREDLDAIQQKYGFSIFDVRNKIAQLPPNSLSTVVMSGHSEGTLLQGMLLKNGMDIFIDAIKSSLIQSKQFSLQSVYVLGCYSMTGGRAIDWHDWKKSFPEMNSVALMAWGFDTRAPGNGGDAGAIILNRLLVTEQKLSQMKDQKSLLKAVKDIAVIKDKNGHTSTQGLSGLVNGSFLSTDKNSVDCLSALPNGCLNKVTFLEAEKKRPHIFDTFIGCLEGNNDEYNPSNHGECTDDLPSSNNDTSNLRKFYDQLQHSSECLGHCNGKKMDAETKVEFQEAGQTPDNIPCPNDVIKLIKHDEIFHNALTYLKPEIDKIDAELVDSPQLQKQFEAIFVHPAAEQPRKLREMLNDFARNLRQDPKPNSADPLQLVNTLKKLTAFPTCAPFSWIEEQEKPAEPSC